MAFDLALGQTPRHIARDSDVGLSATTTEDVDIKLAALLTDTNNLNEDISTWAKTTKANQNNIAFVRAWFTWRDETYKFIKSWKSGSFFKIKLAWNYYDNAVERMRELAKWRERWEGLAGRQSTAPSSTPPSKDEDKSSLWKWGALLGLGGLGALLLSQKLKG